MRILITGARGFIGRNLNEGLSGSFEIFSPRSSELDLTDYNSLKKYISDNRVEAVVHTAVHSAISIGREEGFHTDLRMLINLTQCLDRLKKLIVLGSGAEFAKSRNMDKVKEEEWGKHIPEDLYGLSKFIMTEIVRREAKMINLRLFGIYGPNEDYRYKFISNAIVKNILGFPIRIKQDVVFDYLYVTDLIPVVEHFLTHQSKFRDYNVTPTKSIKLSEIAKIINSVSDIKSQILVIKKNLNYEYTGSNERIRKEIPSWKITGYLDGIQKQYRYYKDIAHTLDVEAIKKDEFLKRSKTL